MALHREYGMPLEVGIVIILNPNLLSFSQSIQAAKSVVHPLDPTAPARNFGAFIRRHGVPQEAGLEDPVTAQMIEDVANMKVHFLPSQYLKILTMTIEMRTYATIAFQSLRCSVPIWRLKRLSIF